jgi:hypothetical protein
MQPGGDEEVFKSIFHGKRISTEEETYYRLY